MGPHGISVANARSMRSSVIFAVFALAAFAAANESVDTVVPEMVATGSAAPTPYVTDKSTTQTHYETEEVVEKPVYENVTIPVEQVHYKRVTKTVPVKKQVEVKEVVEAPHTGCDLVVESCFATPTAFETPAWKAPVIQYQHSYSNLCAAESKAKKIAERKEKAAEKKTKEAASKGISAEITSKKLEKALKEAQVKCSEKNKKAEIVAKESSRKSAEKEEKLFKSERDSKESASKAISMAKTHERIVYVPSAAPAIEVAGPAVEEDCATNPEQVKCLPKPSPAPAPLAPAKKFVCDSKKCQCVESTNAEGDDFNYCTEMCQTGPGCAPSPPPPAEEPAPALPPILSPAPVVYPEVYPFQQPAVPAAMPVYNDEGAKKSQFKLKESMMKTREKSAKSMTESKTKQSEQEMKVSATELKQKGSESAAKEKANKHQYHMENFYKSRARPYPVAPMVEQPESRPLEKGIKNVRRMKERFSKAKIEGVNAIKEAWSKHGHAKKKTNHCKETHEVCGKIHAASAARQVQAAQAADAHTASLETNCAKTVAFAKEAAEELTYHVCAAAAAKMDGLIKTIQNDFEYTNVTIPTISWGATFASAYGGEAAVEQQSMEKQQAQAMEAAKYYKK